MNVAYPYALDQDGNIVFIRDADPRQNYYCSCSAKMVHKGQKKFNRKKAAHFSHPPTRNGASCPNGDALFHHAVVKLIADGFRERQQAGEPYRIIIPCARCGDGSHINIGRPWHSVQIEAIDAVATGTRADLLFTLADDDNRLAPPAIADRIAVEVIHHHEPSPDTAKKYAASETPVVYIRIGKNTLCPEDNPNYLNLLRYCIVADRAWNLPWRCRNIECGSVTSPGFSAGPPTLEDAQAERAQQLKDQAAQLKAENDRAEIDAFSAAVSKMKLETLEQAVTHCALCDAPCEGSMAEQGHMALRHHFAAARSFNGVNVDRQWLRVSDPPEHDLGQWWARKEEIRV